MYNQATIYMRKLQFIFFTNINLSYLTYIPLYEYAFILGANWFRTEWNDSKALVWWVSVLFHLQTVCLSTRNKLSGIVEILQQNKIQNHVFRKTRNIHCLELQCLIRQTQDYTSLECYWDYLDQSILWWAHLLESGSSKLSCLSMTWLKNDLTFAQIMSPFPDGVDVALHNRWFWHGCIHGIKASQPLSFEIFVRTLWTSDKT